MPKAAEHTASLIKQAREAKNLTQPQVAKAIGVKRQSVSLWESGHTKPRTAHIDKLCKTLGIQREQLANAFAQDFVAAA